MTDHEIEASTTITLQPHQPETSAMSPPTHIIIPPTPITATTNTGQDRPSPKPEISLPAIIPLPSPPSTTPNSEPEDPLSYQWRQSPKRSFALLRRLSGHRRSRSLPADLGEMVSDPGLRRRLEQDDDNVAFVPEQLRQGMEMLRVKRKGIEKRICWIDPINAYVAWDSKNSARCMYSAKRLKLTK